MNKLSLNYTGIGSFPFRDENAPKNAMDFIFSCCPDFPYWAQLPHYKKEEDMVFQFTSNLTGLEFDEDEGRYYLDDETGEFFEGLETLFVDYETVLASEKLEDCKEILDKYKITKPYSSTFDMFLEELKTKSPSFTKGSITGPFTFSTSITEKNGKLAYYNETLREVIIKFLTLKALFQVMAFREAAKDAVPVIFMDEPSISQVGSCAFVTVKKEDVISMISQISSALKQFGAISGIHCCGKTDWNIATESSVDVINFDAYNFSQSIGTHSKKLEDFMKKGGFLSFGIVPTMDDETLEGLNSDKIYEKFMDSISCLTSKNIDKKLILDHCFFTPSCGLGSLGGEMAKKALNLCKELSQKMKEETL